MNKRAAEKYANYIKRFRSDAYSSKDTEKYEFRRRIANGIEGNRLKRTIVKNYFVKESQKNREVLKKRRIKMKKFKNNREKSLHSTAENREFHQKIAKFVNFDKHPQKIRILSKDSIKIYIPSQNHRNKRKFHQMVVG